MTERNTSPVRKSYEEAAGADSVTKALEGNGIEDTSWDLFYFFVAPVSALKDFIFPLRDWYQVAKRLRSARKLIRS